MKNKILLLLAVTVVLTTSCKKESALNKIDENAKEIAPANPNDVAKPELVEAIDQPSAQPLTPEQQQAQEMKSQPVSNTKVTEMKFNKVEHDFGTINQSDKVEYTFKFTNTGKNDLIISNAVGSCGCTVPEYPKEPIKPGKQGKMKVIFNPAGKTGMQTKTITVNANTPNGVEKLTVKASITAPDGEGKATVTPLPLQTP